MRKRGLRKTLYIISGYSILVALFFAVIGFLIWLVGFKLFCLMAAVIASLSFAVIFAIALIEEGKD